jgi:diadenylate cyclase
MGYIVDVFSNLFNVIKSITIADIIDIIILSYLLYKCIKLIRETRAEQLIKGIVLLCVAYFIVDKLELKTLGFLLQNFFQWGILAIIIMFQPELRRALEKMGRAKVSNFNVFSIGSDSADAMAYRWEEAINAIVDASVDLSASKTGALIVIERLTKLGEQIDTGTIINAKPSAAVLENIFYPNTPLHDGAVIIRDGRIHAAGCFLPKPQKEELVMKSLGSRHRAAIGMSEISDSIVIVVSEETGIISIAEEGQLTRGFTKDNLKQFLKSKLIPEKPSESKTQKAKKIFRGKVKTK